MRLFAGRADYLDGDTARSVLNSRPRFPAKVVTFQRIPMAVVAYELVEVEVQMGAGCYEAWSAALAGLVAFSALRLNVQQV